MRTITEKLSSRLKVQAKEADIIGLKKLASHLERLSSIKTRSNSDSYVYSESELYNDVEVPLWDAVLRVADYYNCNINAAEVQGVIEKMAEELENFVKRQGGIQHGVGAYEPAVLGEDVHEEAEIEVE